MKPSVCSLLSLFLLCALVAPAFAYDHENVTLYDFAGTTVKGCFSYDDNWVYDWQTGSASHVPFFDGTTIKKVASYNTYHVANGAWTKNSSGECAQVCVNVYEWQPTESLSIINNGAEAVLAGYACFETACTQEFVDYARCQNDPTLNHPVFNNHQWDQDYEDGIDCGGLTGYSCDYACAADDDLTTDMITGKQICISYSAANPAGVCPDGFSRVEGSTECTYRYDARGYDPEYPSNYPDFTDIPSDTPAPIDNTEESSATTVESETTTNPDGSVTQKTTENTTSTDASGTTTDTTKTTETTTNTDGTKTEQVRTETKITTATGADGKTTTTATTNVYAADGTLLSSTTNTSTGSSSNSSGTGSPTKPTAMNVSLDLGPVTERIDKSNLTLDDIKKLLSTDDFNPQADLDKLTSAIDDSLDSSGESVIDSMSGAESPGFNKMPFNESLSSEVGGLIPDSGTCTDLTFPYTYLGENRQFVIECDNFETYLKPILKWVFYGFTAIYVYYSFTAPVGENK